MSGACTEGKVLPDTLHLPLTVKKVSTGLANTIHRQLFHSVHLQQQQTGQQVPWRAFGVGMWMVPTSNPLLCTVGIKAVEFIRP